MINEPFEPVSEPRVCGWPYHGVLAERRVAGALEYVWVFDDVVYPVPSAIEHVPFSSYVSHKVRHPSVAPIDLTPEEISGERAEGREWFDFATIAGDQSVFYGKNLGVCSWIAVLDDGKAWRVSVFATQEPGGGRYKWMMEYGRTALGPISRYAGGPSVRTFRFEISPEAADTLLFSAASAQARLGGNGNHGVLQDVSRNGTRAIIDYAIVRVITSADLAPYSLDLTSVSGELPIAPLNIVVHGSKLTTTTSSYGRYRRESGMYLQRYDLTQASLSNMPINESSSPLAAGAVYPSAIQRVNSIDPAFSAMWIDYALYDVPPLTEVETWETDIKAHLSEDDDLGIIRFRVVSELTSTQTFSGQACAWAAFYSQGANGPDFGRCPPPTSVVVTTTYMLKQTIEYGGERYIGERSWSHVESSAGVTITDCTSRPAASFTTGNYSKFGVLTVPYAAPGEGQAFHRGRPAVSATLTPDTWDAVSAPPFPIQPDASNASLPAVWTRNNFSMREPVAGEAYVRFTAVRPFPALVARYSAAENHFVNSMPAAAAMPKGIYYKGKFITPWLPAHSDVWTMNPKTYEVHVFTRASAYNADGYVNAIYI